MPRNILINEQMRAESRRRILATAGELFAQKGYFNVRMAEIAHQAGMSPGNIYWYFPGKEDVLKAILEDFFATFEGMLVQVETSSGSALERLQRLVEGQLSILEQYGDRVTIFLSILGHGGPALMKELGFDTVAIGMRFHQHLQPVLQAAIQEGVIPPAEPNALAVFIFSFFNGMQITYGQDWKQIPAPMITQAVLRLLGHFD